MARAINDIMRIREFVAGTIRTTMVLFFTAVVGLSFMAWLSWQLTLAILVPMPSLGWRIATLVLFMRIHNAPKRALLNSGFVQENLNGIRTVQAMAQEDREIARFEESSAQFTEDNQHSSGELCTWGIDANFCWSFDDDLNWLRRSLTQFIASRLAPLPLSSPTSRFCSGLSERLGPS